MRLVWKVIEIRVVIVTAFTPLGSLRADVAPVVREAFRVSALMVGSAAVVPGVLVATFQFTEPEACLFVLTAFGSTTAWPAIDAVHSPGVYSGVNV